MTSRALEITEGESEAVVREVALHYLEKRMPIGKPLCDPQSVVEYLQGAMSGLDREIFAVVYLNKANIVLGYQEVAQGTVDECAVYPREIAKEVLLRGAKSVILAHNHPSGRVMPSKDDLEITRRISSAMRTLEAEVLDHIIVAGSEYFSMSEHGLI